MLNTLTRFIAGSRAAKKIHLLPTLSKQHSAENVSERRGQCKNGIWNCALCATIRYDDSLVCERAGDKPFCFKTVYKIYILTQISIENLHILICHIFYMSWKGKDTASLRDPVRRVTHFFRLGRFHGRTNKGAYCCWYVVRRTRMLCTAEDSLPAISDARVFALKYHLHSKHFCNSMSRSARRGTVALWRVTPVYGVQLKDWQNARADSKLQTYAGISSLVRCCELPQSSAVTSEERLLRYTGPQMQKHESHRVWLHPGKAFMLGMRVKVRRVSFLLSQKCAQSC